MDELEAWRKLLRANHYKKGNSMSVRVSGKHMDIGDSFRQRALCHQPVVERDHSRVVLVRFLRLVMYEYLFVDWVC